MVVDVFTEHAVILEQILADALAYFRRGQQPTGLILDDPTVSVMDVWDNVHVLKALTMWREDLPEEHQGTVSELTDGILRWLKTRETSIKVLTWGGAPPEDPTGYCAETTSEYIAALIRLGHEREARQKAAYLRSRQLPGGEWEIEHPYLPADGRVQPSVTAFVLDALAAADMPPFDLEAALAYVVKTQRPDGDFGVHYWYYDTPYYFLRPVTAILARYGYHAAVAGARNFVLARQLDAGYWPRNGEDGSSDEFHTALALETLAHAGLGIGHPAVRRGVGWLLSRRRPDGSWDGGRYPDYPQLTLSLIHASAGAESFGRPSQNVYTTAQALSALRHLTKVEARHAAVRY